MHGLKVGDTLVSVWGATMVLVSFYRVIKTTPKMVHIVALEPDEKGDGGFLTGHSTPTMIHGTKVLKRLVKQTQNHGYTYVVGEYSSERAFKWNGQPVAFNHCD